MKKFIVIFVLILSVFPVMGDDFWDTGMFNFSEKDDFTDEASKTAGFCNLEFYTGLNTGTILVKLDENSKKTITVTTYILIVEQMFGVYAPILSKRDTTLSYRFDDDSSVSVIVSPSVTGKTVFLPDSLADEFIDKIKTSTTLKIRIKTWDGGNMDLTFNNINAFTRELTAIGL